MLKSLKQAKQNITSTTKNIWIFIDNQAGIKRFSNNSKSSGQEITYKIKQEAEFLFSQNIQLHICWVPGHVNIYGNEQADKAAKLAAIVIEFNDKIIDCSNEIGISFSHLKSQVKKSLL